MSINIPIDLLSESFRYTTLYEIGMIGHDVYAYHMKRINAIMARAIYGENFFSESRCPDHISESKEIVKRELPPKVMRAVIRKK